MCVCVSVSLSLSLPACLSGEQVVNFWGTHMNGRWSVVCGPRCHMSLNLRVYVCVCVSFDTDSWTCCLEGQVEGATVTGAAAPRSLLQCRHTLRSFLGKLSGGADDAIGTSPTADLKTQIITSPQPYTRSRRALNGPLATRHVQSNKNWGSHLPSWAIRNTGCRIPRNPELNRKTSASFLFGLSDFLQVKPNQKQMAFSS